MRKITFEARRFLLPREITLGNHRGGRRLTLRSVNSETREEYVEMTQNPAPPTKKRYLQRALAENVPIHQKKKVLANRPLNRAFVIKKRTLFTRQRALLGAGEF